MTCDVTARSTSRLGSRRCRRWVIETWTDGTQPTTTPTDCTWRSCSSGRAPREAHAATFITYTTKSHALFTETTWNARIPVTSYIAKNNLHLTETTPYHEICTVGSNTWPCKSVQCIPYPSTPSERLSHHTNHPLYRFVYKCKCIILSSLFPFFFEKQAWDFKINECWKILWIYSP